MRLAVSAAIALLIANPAWALGVSEALSDTCTVAKTALQSYSDDNVGELLADFSAIERAEMDDPGHAIDLDLDRLDRDMDTFEAQFDNPKRGPDLLQRFISDNCR